MDTLVFETALDGHRAHYIGLLIRALAECGSRITVALPSNANQSPEFQTILSNFGSAAHFDTWLPTLKGRFAHGSFAKPSLLQQAITRSNAKYVIIPHIDGLGSVLGLLNMVGGWRRGKDHILDGISHRPSFAYKSRPFGTLKAMAGLHLLQRARLSLLWQVDILGAEWIRSHKHPLGRITRILPDPVNHESVSVTKAEARIRLGLPLNRNYAFCIGCIDERKGIPLLLRALKIGPVGPEVTLVLFGTHSPGVRHMLSEFLVGPQMPQILSFDRFSSYEDLSLAFIAADLVCTTHDSHIGISSIALRAAAAGRPVLASDFGWLARVVPQFGLGWTTQSNNPERLHRDFARSMRECQNWRPSDLSRRLVEFHRCENFVNEIKNRFLELMGNPTRMPTTPFPT